MQWALYFSPLEARRATSYTSRFIQFVAAGVASQFSFASQLVLTASRMHKWGLMESANCPYRTGAQQDTDHLVLSFPVTKLDGGYTVVEDRDEKLTAWIDQHKLEM